MTKRAVVISFVLLATVGIAVVGTRRRPERAAASPEARQIVATLRARPASPLLPPAPPPETGVPAPELPAAENHPSARVAVPHRSTEPMHVEDATSGAGIDVKTKDVRDVAAEAADGYLVYPHAHASGGTLLHRGACRTAPKTS